jgi:hypothetical protein
MQGAVAYDYGVVGCRLVQIPAMGMALLRQVKLIVVGAGEPLARGQTVGPAADSGFYVSNRLNRWRTEVEAMQLADEGENMAVDIVEAGNYRPAPAIDYFSLGPLNLL